MNFSYLSLTKRTMATTTCNWYHPLYAYIHTSTINTYWIFFQTRHKAQFLLCASSVLFKEESLYTLFVRSFVCFVCFFMLKETWLRLDLLLNSLKFLHLLLKSSIWLYCFSSLFVKNDHNSYTHIHLTCCRQLFGANIS